MALEGICVNKLFSIVLSFPRFGMDANEAPFGRYL
jgi:hypothetical protein